MIQDQRLRDMRCYLVLNSVTAHRLSKAELKRNQTKRKKKKQEETTTTTQKKNLQPLEAGQEVEGSQGAVTDLVVV